MTTVSHDNRAITIDGKRELLISGAIHYPRSHFHGLAEKSYE